MNSHISMYSLQFCLIVKCSSQSFLLFQHIQQLAFLNSTWTTIGITMTYITVTLFHCAQVLNENKDLGNIVLLIEIKNHCHIRKVLGIFSRTNGQNTLLLIKKLFFFYTQHYLYFFSNKTIIKKLKSYRKILTKCLFFI